MRPQGFKRFYGDGARIGYSIGPGDAVTLIVDNSLNSVRQIDSVWLGRVQNFDEACAFLAALGPPQVGKWQYLIRELALDRDTARKPVKHVYVSLSGRDETVVIHCTDVAES